jgi:hypothetical protein
MDEWGENESWIDELIFEAPRIHMCRHMKFGRTTKTPDGSSSTFRRCVPAGDEN